MQALGIKEVLKFAVIAPVIAWIILLTILLDFLVDKLKVDFE